jgi:group I intron endonuclease
MNFVYLTTNLVNGKQYVGSHEGNLNDSYLGSGKILRMAIKKYGIENFQREVIVKCDPSINLILEEKYIKEYNTLQPNGYNISPTGGTNKNGGKLSEETKNKISKKLKGRKAWNKGIPFSRESKQKMSDKRKGIKLSEETKQKMTVFQKGRIKSPEECKNISESKKGQNNPMYGKDSWNKGIKGKQCWVSNDILKETKFILSSKLNKYLKDGWYKGRTKYNK